MPRLTQGVKIRGFHVRGAFLLARDGKVSNPSHITMRISAHGQSGETEPCRGGLEQRKSEKGSLLFLMEGIQSSHCLMKS